MIDNSLMKNKAFINGQWVDSSTNKNFAVFNPADGALMSNVPDMNKEDTRLAIDAADNAFQSWSSFTSLKRDSILRAWADGIDANLDGLAYILTSEQGKPLSEAKSEITAAAATIRWCAMQGQRLYGDFIDGHKAGTKIVISRHPIGIVGAITPWNFPVSMITRKVAPALAAGCTVVLKPSEETPLCALALAHLAQKAGMPDGVLNVITTANAQEVGAVLTGDTRVKKISFTGSTATGKILMAQSAQNVQKISLELGGNAPFIVFPSANIDAAIDGAMASKFRNAGQTCICANRIFVHQDIFNQYLELFVHKVRGLKVGSGLNSDASIGPLINVKAIEKVENMIKEAVEKGAIVHCGGKKHSLSGTYFEPSVLTNVDEGCAMYNQEIFGPVACLYPFDDEQDVVLKANNTPYGLAGYIYSQDLSQVWRVSDGLDYGMVGVNEPFLATDLAPFGGVKESGIGNEGGEYGLLEYTKIKYRVFGV